MRVEERETNFKIQFTTREGDEKQGPLALLWSLIESYEVDIFSVSLSRITDDFLAYIRQQSISLSEQSDFAIMAARLVYHKSKLLLPNPGFESEPEPDVLPVELVEQLLEYKKYQQAADVLRTLEGQAQRSLDRAPGWQEYEEGLNFLQVDLLSLLKAFQDFLVQQDQREPLEIEEEEVSIEEMMNWVRRSIKQVERLSFFHFIANFSLQQAIVAFLSLLELARLRELTVSQDEVGGDIFMMAYE